MLITITIGFQKPFVVPGLLDEKKLAKLGNKLSFLESFSRHSYVSRKLTNYQETN